jgi:hypothetical protein
MDEGRRAARLLDRPGIAVVVDVAVGNEDPPHVAEREAEGGEAVLDGSAPFARADAGIEERDAAASLLDDVDVRRPARLGERHRHRNAVDPERGEHLCYFSFFTSSVSSGSALNRSATRP